MACPGCGLLAYPRISPAVMVLVCRGDDLLLARSPHFRPGMFSALAVLWKPAKPSNSAPSAKSARKSAWRLPTCVTSAANRGRSHSLMIAFFADYTGENHPPTLSEIEAADWFPRNSLPPLPDEASIARHLIDAACSQHH